MDDCVEGKFVCEESDVMSPVNVWVLVDDCVEGKFVCEEGDVMSPVNVWVLELVVDCVELSLCVKVDKTTV